MKAYTVTPVSRLLYARGENYAGLAKKCGLNVRTVYNIACGNNRSRSGRAAVETALGVSIWPKTDTSEGSS